MHQEGAEMVLVTDRIGRPQKIAFRGDCLKVLMSLKDNQAKCKPCSNASALAC